MEHKIVKAIHSCLTVGQLNTCYEWVADLRRKKIISKPLEDKLLKLMSSQHRMMRRRREAKIKLRKA